MTHDLLILGGTLVTGGASPRVVERGAVWAQDGVIAAVAEGREAGDLAARHADAPTLDAAGCVVMPGLVNAHTHLYSAFARGIAPWGAPPRDFAEVLDRLWWRLDRSLTDDDVYHSALVGAIESARHGATTLFDHHASPNACAGSLSLIRDALDSVGLRGVLAYEVSDRDGRGLEGIAENIRFIEACRRKGGGRFAGLFGLHASFTLGDASLAAAREAADALGAPFHVHVAEDPVDSARTRAAHGAGAVARLAGAGVLREGTIAAHCIHLEPGDREILRERGAVVAHCPQSNTNNAVGTADVLGMMGDGIPVVLGTDGFTPNVLAEAQAGTIVQHLARRDPSAGFGEIIGMALARNAEVAARCLSAAAAGGAGAARAPVRLGALAPGHAADLAIFRYDPPTPLSAASLAGHFLFGLHRAPAAATVVAGRVVQRGGRIERLDEEAVFARSRELAAALWKRFHEG
jgi:putative selenium metabolism protein SsnA